MTPEFWAIIGVGAGVLGSYLNIHKAIGDLRERVTRLEERIPRQDDPDDAYKRAALLAYAFGFGVEAARSRLGEENPDND